jgi:PAS domain S-box-containing protein
MPGAGPGQELLARAAVGLAVLDRDGRIADANACLERITARSGDELRRLGLAGIVHPDDWSWQRALVAEVAEGRHRELSLDARCVRGDGSVAHLAITLSPLDDAERRVVAAVQDVTAWRLGDDALRRNELRFRRLIERLPAAAYTCDADGLITFFNEHATQLWGRAPRLNDPSDRWCGSFKLFAPDGTPIDHASCGMARALREGRDYDGEEIVIERPDGTRVAALAHASPIRDERGEIVACMNILVDITDRKRAEDRLRESERRFEQFMEHLPGLAWIKDLEGRYLFVNEAAEQAFQRSRDQLYGRRDDELFPERTSTEFRENDQKALSSGAGIETVETLEHPDGLHHSIVSKFPIPGPDGSPALVGGIAVDISARIRAEERLKDADRRKNEFLATLAHELRNPLAPIRSSLELLRRGDTGAETIRMLERQVDQMVRLVDDLLDVARITRGHVELQRARVALAEVVRSAIETARPLIAAARHELTLSLPTQPLWLDADPLRLSQVLVNLLNNAAKYTPDGGRIELTAEVAGDEVTLSVRDNGIGIGADALPRIFDPFTQARSASEHAQGGLGIGLALVSQLAALHGGRAEARSGGPGQGSEFRVTLPLAEAPEPVVHAIHSVRSAKRASGLRGPVLVVDDNRDAAESLALLLRSRGVRVETAFDGAEALDVARRLEPAVVLLDLGMPGMDGFEVAQRLRAEPACRDARLVALTGWNQPSVREQCARAGFDHHVVKPVQLEALEQLLALPPGAAAS